MVTQLANIMLKFKRGRLGYSPVIPGVVGGFQRLGKNNDVKFYWTGSTNCVEAYEKLIRGQFRKLQRFIYLENKTREFLESRGYSYKGEHPVTPENLTETLALLNGHLDEWIFFYDPTHGMSRQPFERMDDAAKRIIRSVPAEVVVKAVKTTDEVAAFDEKVTYRNVTFRVKQYIDIMPGNSKRGFRTTIRHMAQANAVVERGKELRKKALARV